MDKPRAILVGGPFDGVFVDDFNPLYIETVTKATLPENWREVALLGPGLWYYIRHTYTREDVMLERNFEVIPDTIKYLYSGGKPSR